MFIYLSSCVVLHCSNDKHCSIFACDNKLMKIGCEANGKQARVIK